MLLSLWADGKARIHEQQQYLIKDDKQVKECSKLPRLCRKSLLKSYKVSYNLKERQKKSASQQNEFIAIDSSPYSTPLLLILFPDLFTGRIPPFLTKSNVPLGTYPSSFLLYGIFAITQRYSYDNLFTDYLLCRYLFDGWSVENE